MRESEVNVLKRLLPYLILKCAEVQSFHGYEVIKLMKKRFGVYFGASTIYPLLHALENEGLLTSHWEIQSVQRPRKIYTITDDGLDTVAALALTMQTVSNFVGRIPQEPTKPERHNVITLDH